MKRVWPLLLVLAMGCGSTAWFPIEVGWHHDYVVQNGMATYVEGIEAKAEVPVSGSRGVELSGPLGISRIAWKGSRLMASMLGGSRIVPPIPILISSAPENAINGKSTLETNGARVEVRYTLTHGREKIKVAAREVETIRTTLVLQTATQTTEVVSHYASGIGLVRQNQHTDGRFDLSIDLLN